MELVRRNVGTNVIYTRISQGASRGEQLPTYSIEGVKNTSRLLPIYGENLGVNAAEELHKNGL